MKDKIVCKSDAEIEKMRLSGRITRQVLEEVQRRVHPGVTTLDLEGYVERRLQEFGAAPAFKGYRGYPACLCASVNDEIVHGIPSHRRLKEGDIVSLDLGVVTEGYYSDAAITVPVGDISEPLKKLLRVTKESVALAIEKARVGNRVGDISATIQEHAESHGFAVVRDLCGHGIGRQLHEEPQVPNFGRPGHGPLLKAGMVVAIEAMVNAGGYAMRVADDHWTALTADGSFSAHFEDVVAVTRNGPDILTQP
jgi:methionyl aminopeptidase